MSITIHWHGHSCFTIESAGYKIALDPFNSVQGYRPVSISAHRVICSHEHFDHNFREGVALLPEEECPFEIDTIHTLHDSNGGKLRGANDITILTAGGISVAHLGDLGCELGAEQIERLKGIDCLLIPIGGTYTIDIEGAIELIHKIQPKVVVPMHYRTNDYGFDALLHIDSFVKAYGGENSNSNTLEILGSEENKCIILKYE